MLFTVRNDHWQDIKLPLPTLSHSPFFHPSLQLSQFMKSLRDFRSSCRPISSLMPAFYLNRFIQLDIVLIVNVQRDKNLTVPFYLSLCDFDNPYIQELFLYVKIFCAFN